MSKLEDLSINDSAIKRIVHQHIETHIAPEINLQNRTIKLIPFVINVVKYRDIKELPDGTFSDPYIWVGYTMKVKSQHIRGSVDDITKSISIPINDYIIEYRNEKIKSLGVSLGDKVRENINEYLEFNSDELFPINSLVRIFGGAVRDSISDNEIHDIDIILGSGSLDYLENVLTENGYKYMESLTPKDLSSIYHDIRVINEPHSWVKGDKIVQLIRPAAGYLEEKNPKIKESIYKKSFTDLIRNVDISCCGVSYDGEKVYENFEGAVSHCKNGIFIVNKTAKMYSDKRIIHRTNKLSSRGWVEVKPSVATNRDLKIDEILNENILDYVPEYKDNLYYSESLDIDCDDDFYI